LPELPLREFEANDLGRLEDYAALHGTALKAAYTEYLNCGGYPEPVLASEIAIYVVFLVHKGPKSQAPWNAEYNNQISLTNESSWPILGLYRLNP